MTDDAVDELVAAAASLPAGDVDRLVTATRGGPEGLRALRSRSGRALRHLCSTVLTMLEHTDIAEICGILRGASRAALLDRRTVDLVWTGPEVPGSVSRLTSEIVADLVDQAHSDVLLVSYAMHTEPRLAAALRRAVDRKVFVQILHERNIDNPRFRGGTTPFPGLPIRRLCWPADQRPDGASMHAKILIIDRRTTLIGSANLTGTAMLRNIECGVLIHDPKIAEEVLDAIAYLTESNALQRYSE
ncbi:MULTISPECIES: DISARM system phospholipase D-like protein DrmC [Mycobacteriales]|uniref:DISARM system phospholipase D-like protein DrmC n=1 Tax=Mycobacteriales TaxID=85007 RepID=UPI001444D105|nr:MULTISPECIES: DISARM system phospholipase D-like protein DrmC [Mycobacteriales]MCZ9330301.1 DISARM system phospholipase D-like protein DrmC [Nocardia farcinica]